MIARIKGIFPLLILGLAMAPKAEASFVVNIVQDGNNVDATGSGSLDTTDLSAYGGETITTGATYPQFAFITLGTGPAFVSFGANGPADFGSGVYEPSTSTSGGPVGISGSNGAVEVPNNYVSGAALTGSAVWDNQTVAGLGLVPGTYTWTWGNGPDADSFVINIAGSSPASSTPEPASFVLLATGLAGIALKRRGR